MKDDEPSTQTTLGDRVDAALKAASEQAMHNSNMGQIEAYRTNHVISLIEKIQTEERRVWRDTLQHLTYAITCGEVPAHLINAATDLLERFPECADAK